MHRSSYSRCMRERAFELSCFEVGIFNAGGRKVARGPRSNALYC